MHRDFDPTDKQSGHDCYFLVAISDNIPARKHKYRDQSRPYEAKTRGIQPSYHDSKYPSPPTTITTSSQGHLYRPRSREVGE